MIRTNIWTKTLLTVSYLSRLLFSPGCSSVAAGQQSFLRPPCYRSDQDPPALYLDQDHYADHPGSRNLHSVPQRPPRCYPPETAREKSETNGRKFTFDVITFVPRSCYTETYPNQHKQRTFHGTCSPSKQ